MKLGAYSIQTGCKLKIMRSIPLHNGIIWLMGVPTFVASIPLGRIGTYVAKVKY